MTVVEAARRHAAEEHVRRAALALGVEVWRFDYSEPTPTRTLVSIIVGLCDKAALRAFIEWCRNSMSTDAAWEVVMEPAPVPPPVASAELGQLIEQTRSAIEAATAVVGPLVGPTVVDPNVIVVGVDVAVSFRDFDPERISRLVRERVAELTQPPPKV